MDWLTFIAQLVTALAWPLSLVVAALLFRKPLIELIPALRRLRFKEFELEFGRELLEAERRAIIIRPSPVTQQVDRTAVPERLQQIAAVSPAAAIIESWRDLEAAAADATARRGISVVGGSWQLFEALKSQGVLNSTQAAILDNLRNLRNKAVHAPEGNLAVEQALRYAEIATMMADYLRRTGEAT